MTDPIANVSARIAAQQAKRNYSKAKKVLEAKSGLALIDLSTIDPRPVEWVWQGRIPLGSLTLLVGDPDAGKSYIATDLSARVTQGAALPLDDRPRQPGDVILCNYEDAADTTIRPRADTAGLGPGKIWVLDEEHFFTARDIDQLEVSIKSIKQHRNLVLVGIDPIGSYIGGKVDAGQDNQVRSVLSPLAHLARKYNVAVVGNMHLNKGEARKAIYRVAGSIAGFVGVARSVLLVGADVKTAKRGIAQIRNANGLPSPPIEFALSELGVAWRGQNDELTADVLTADANGVSTRGAKGRDIAEWLHGLLDDKAPQLGKPILDEAEKRGYSLATVHRIANEMGVHKYQEQKGEPFSPTLWYLEPSPPLESS